MTDPRRLSDQPLSDLGANLLRAGMEEGPSPDAMKSTLVALGVVGAGLAATSTAGAAAATSTAGAAAATAAVKPQLLSTIPLFVKWMAIGAIGGGTVVGASMTMLRSQPEAKAPRAMAPSSSVAHRPQPMPRRITVIGEATATPPPTEPVASASPPPRNPRIIEEYEPSLAPSAAPSTRLAVLAAETRFVDHARSLLHRGDANAVVALLADYEARFPTRQLLPEVLYLRMEAASRLGNPPEARRLAERVLRDFPASPQASRARELVIQSP